MVTDLETQVSEIEPDVKQQEAISNEPETTQDVVARELSKYSDRARDEAGRFAKEQEKKEQEKHEVKEQEKQNVAENVAPVKVRNKWAAWKKEAQDVLNTLDPAIQAMIEERESQFHKGIQSYKDDATYGRSLRAVIQPHKEYLDQLGVQPDVAISNLIQTERTLRTGSPEQKAQLFQKLAMDYGIDLQALQQVQFNPETYQLQQQYAALQAQMQAMSQSKQMAEEAALNQTIEQFAQGKDYFDDVRETMADLLDRGLAADLDDAYQKAIRLNDDVFRKWQAAQQASSDRQKLEAANNAAKNAKAAAVSVKGSPVGSHRPTQASSTEDAVRAAMAAHGIL